MLYNGNMQDQCYRVDSPAVIYEQFDSELVAIHLDTGAYHSLVGAGADAFLLLADEASPAEIAVALQAKYDADTGHILKTLTPFLSALESEKLIVKVDVRRDGSPAKLSFTGTKLPFGAPTLEAYHDLQSLFLLDPVHEVGDEGWPKPRETQNETGGLPG